MHFDPSKTPSSALGFPLKRPFAHQGTAIAIKPTPHVAEDDNLLPRTSSLSGDQRPGKVPKLASMHFPSRGQLPQHIIVSPSFEVSSSSSSQSKKQGSLSSRLSVPPSDKGQSSQQLSKRAGKSKAKSRPGSSLLPELEGPLHDSMYIEKEHRVNIGSQSEVKASAADNPKSPVANFAAAAELPLNYESKEYFDSSTNRRIIRCTLVLNTSPQIVGIGDHTDKKAAERLCALSTLYQLHDKGLLDKPPKAPGTPTPAAPQQVVLRDGSVVNYERARSFMDYYCRIYGFGKPEVEYQELPVRRGNSTWEAVMTVDGRRIGMGSAGTKKNAQVQCYLDVTQYLENCDPDLWKRYAAAAKSGKDLGLAPKVWLPVSQRLGDEIEDLCREIRRSTLYKNRPAIVSLGSRAQDAHPAATVAPRPSYPRHYPSHMATNRSAELKKRREAYLQDPNMEKLRTTRAALPIFTRSEELMTRIKDNDVMVCMAATGSGKTTQIPQLILDDYIDRGEGAHCNIICTQPRRLAALSVADRVAKERGEVVGSGSIGYSVRFESKLPEEHGSITFCTVGVLLRRLQTVMSEGGLTAAKFDEVTHILVDEVHERDVDTDLLLVVLKRVMEDRKARNIPLKVVLMSATIDPRLFQEYFLDDVGNEAKVVEIPGRTFPVTKHYLDDFVGEMKRQPQLGWVFKDESVSRYLAREEAYAQHSSTAIPSPTSPSSRHLSTDDELDLPAPLVAATISHVLQQSDSGHVLVFLPGWEEISSVQRFLLGGDLPLPFRDQSKYSLHVLHSTIPLAEQQVIFEPPPHGIRRVILATNIAETSVTIPDVVYVVDAAKVKELRYDPDRHMSSLVSAWVGSSNLNQRAGRAGRHRPGEYYGLLSQVRAANLHPHQTVEMKRVDLSNVVMHVKALSFPGMEVEEVLAATIEPPEAERVAAATTALQMVGALDHQKNLTSLGRVLLQLPVEVHMGRLVLYGTFFRCLDKALTLAAILTNRDPFVSPMHLKAEAAAIKATWSPREFRSDALTILNAYNAWHDMYRNGEHARANRFCNDNFLSKPTLLLITKIRGHLLQSLYQAGVIDMAEGNTTNYGRGRDREWTVPVALNANGDSQPLLAALVAVASQPKFAVRTGEMTLRTQHDKITFIHPSSVNHRKHIKTSDYDPSLSQGEKQIYAYTEKRQNLTVTGQTPQMYLINTTRLDPMTYLLFGADAIQVTERGLECDEWLPIVGNLDTLDDIQRLKALMESCMLRVFEGIHMSKSRGPLRPGIPAREEDEAGEEMLNEDLSLSPREISDLDMVTRDIVRILNRYSDERMVAQSTTSSRNATPTASPAFSTSRLPGSRSGYSTPYGIGSAYNSRPGTPSRLSRSFHS
ncbi:hypothetical protein PAXRUDRAFT_12465 [Paxillus rubicundulus Ve08.2h10]|uniref:RNA helicase n=1 Tax=Paxillus rubicundulus Ve08.2h10 TaxID=930991 RepID=A0A0D0DVU1_9AGAM|nr:hypothetical protein PAXRUDRAFT_12465 [Paxillus rubicundulus Ve08.2h10]